MYNQLRDWIIYGVLNDKYDEFYICVDKNNEKQAQQPKQIDDDFALLGINEIEELYMGNRFSSNYSNYSFKSDLLPTYLTMKTANMILFTGELLQLFQAKFLNDIFTSGDNEPPSSSSSSAVANSSSSTVNNKLSRKVQYISEFDKCENSSFFGLILNLNYVIIIK